MPTYTVKDPRSGQTKRITGDSPPTEAELETLFTAKPEHSMVDTAVGALPAIGGFAGSLVGAGKWNPLGMAGAAVGGAGGEFVRQIVQAARGKADDVPNSVAGQYEAALKEGALQAGLEGGGRAVIGGGARLIKGVQKMALPTIPQGVRDAAVDAALDLLPGGRMMRAGGRALVKSMRGATADAIEAPMARQAAKSAAESLPAGFERYLPNVSASHAPTMDRELLMDALQKQTVADPRRLLTEGAPKAMSGPRGGRAFSEGEERGIAELDSLMERLHGKDYIPKGNGLYREPAADAAQSVAAPARGVFRGRYSPPLPPANRELPQWASGVPTGGPESPMWGPGSELGGGARAEPSWRGRELERLLRKLASGKSGT